MNKKWVTVYSYKNFEIEFMNGAESGEAGYRIKGYETLPLFVTVGDVINYIDSGKVYII